MLIFIRINRTGAVEQYPVRFHILPDNIQYPALQAFQLRKSLLAGTIFNVPFFSHASKAGTGQIS